MNAISVIFPYKYNGQWVFDDAEKALVHEALIAGIDTMIDRATADIPNASKGFKLIFSPTPFPNYNLRLEKKRSEYGGTWYYCPEYGQEGWLCPALFKWFAEAPPELYAQVVPRE